ncbi:MAG: diadenylate cyclase CdaA [Tissierellia bacterium]|nr:diadenylate cyclase CdaA [Tissierellia bacterium]
MNILNKLANLFQTIWITDIIDILIIAFIIYKIIQLLKETRAEQVLKGFIIVLVLAKISEIFNLFTVNWLLSNFLTVGLILIIVVFQPELRRAFEKIGRGNALSIFSTEEDTDSKVVDEIVRAMSSLSRQKIGALVVIERKVGLNDIAESGTKIDGYVSSELLINTFIPNTPLHDGAVIIKGDKIKAAACFLPLTNDNTLSKELGTRHRAAIGISERSDCLVIVVSEETGTISCVEYSKISRHFDEDTLREKLLSVYKQDDAKSIGKRRVEDNDKE